MYPFKGRRSNRSVRARKGEVRGTQKRFNATTSEGTNSCENIVLCKGDLYDEFSKSGCN